MYCSIEVRAMLAIEAYKGRKVLFIWTLCGVSCGVGIFFPGKKRDCLAFLQQLFDLTTFSHTKAECRPYRAAGMYARSSHVRKVYTLCCVNTARAHAVASQSHFRSAWPSSTVPNARSTTTCVCSSRQLRLRKVPGLARWAQRMCAHRARCCNTTHPRCANPRKQLRIAKTIEKGADALGTGPIGAQVAVQCARRRRSQPSCARYSSAATANLQIPKSIPESASQMLFGGGLNSSSRCVWDRTQKTRDICKNRCRPPWWSDEAESGSIKLAASAPVREK